MSARLRVAATIAALAAAAACATPAWAGDGDGSPVEVTLESASGTSIPAGERFAFRAAVENPQATAEQIVLAFKVRRVVDGEEVWFAERPHSADPGHTEMAEKVATGQWFGTTGDYEVIVRSSEGDTDTLPFTVTAATVAVPQFEDVTEPLGLSAELHAGSICNGNHSAGAAWADVEGDGDLDLYLPDQAGVSKLFVNEGGTFTDRAAQSGVTNDLREGHGASFADYDNDGDQDLFVVNVGTDRLYRNDGSGVFTDVAAKAGVADPRSGSSASWADYDSDGNLDLYVARWGGCVEEEYLTDSLYHSNGDGTFEDVSAQLAATGPTDGRGFLGGWFDYDNDNDVDLYLANDYAVGPNPKPNALWRNDGFGPGEAGFVNVTGASGTGASMNSMGLGIGDPDRDLDLDVAVSNMMAKRLFENNGDGTFADIAGGVGVARPIQRFDDTTPLTEKMSITWGLTFDDLNNDGWEDLYVAAGSMTASPDQPNELFTNDGTGEFLDLSAFSGADDPMSSRGVAVADYDRDGKLDLYVVNQNGEPRLYRNKTATGGAHWLEIDTLGTASNRDGCGATIIVGTGADRQMRQVFCGSTSLSSGSDKTVHFGLGGPDTTERVQVTWPSGRVQVLTNVAVDQLLTVREAGGADPDPDPDPVLDVGLGGRTRQMAGRPIKLELECNKGCDAMITGKISTRPRGRSTAKRSWKLRRVPASMASAGSMTVKLKLRPRLARKLRRQARRGKRFKAALSVDALAQPGERARANRRIVLR